MTSISPASALAALLRSQLGTSTKTAPAIGAQAAAPGSAGKPGVQGRTPVSHAPPEDLQSRIARRVLALEPADPGRRRKIFRMFLEAVLLQEWGSQLANDPAFHRLVDAVQAQMAADAHLHGLMEELTQRLLDAAAKLER